MAIIGTCVIERTLFSEIYAWYNSSRRVERSKISMLVIVGGCGEYGIVGQNIQECVSTVRVV